MFHFYDGHHWLGMHLFWWIFWILFLVVVLRWFGPVAKHRGSKDAPP